MLEVEQKFSIDTERESSLVRQLASLGADEQPSIRQSDTYYNHPSRDFAQTDEALRVRTVGEQSFVTYKGAKQGTLAKTRYELELPLADQTAEGWHTILIKLGFVEVASVHKKRTPHRLNYEGRMFEIVLDEVEGLGHYVEVETVVEGETIVEVEATAENESLDVSEKTKGAEQAVANLAGELGLMKPEMRSYLEMLLVG